VISIHLRNVGWLQMMRMPKRSFMVDYVLACIAAVLLHEMAHVLAARASGIRIKRVGITWKGPYIVREQGPPFANLCIALAGPAMNLAFALLCWRFAPQFSLVNLALGGYNLLPIRGLDGYNAFAAYRRLRVSAPLTAVVPGRSIVVVNAKSEL
jgi:Zn-dependent protease